VPDPLVPSEGHLPVRAAFPTPESLGAVAAPPDVHERWTRRLRDVAAVAR